MDAKRLFDQLIDLTAIRDIEFLEISLLRTLEQYLKPIDLRLIRTDNEMNLRSEIVLGDEKSDLNDSDKELSDEIKDIILHLNQTNTTEYTLEIETGFLTLYSINKTQHSISYLVILECSTISVDNKYLVMGLLMVFRNYCDLLAENITDSLTGLLNRKSFDRTMDKVYQLLPASNEAYEEDRRHNTASKFWLVMLDIDHFKSINDKYGHVYDDDVLILLAHIIKTCFRDDDLIFRFGGEEFVLIIKCDDLAGAKQALQRLLDRVSSHVFPRVGRVTVSMGAVRIEQGTFSATLLDYADQALYYCKENGRNQLAFFEELVEQGIANLQNIDSGEVDLF